MPDQNDEENVASSSSRGSRGGGAPPSVEFSSFHAMVRKDREAVTERARVDLEVTATEQLRLMIKIFQVKLRESNPLKRRSRCISVRYVVNVEKGLIERAKKRTCEEKDQVL